MVFTVVHSLPHSDAVSALSGCVKGSLLGSAASFLISAAVNDNKLSVSKALLISRYSAGASFGAVQ